MKKFTLISTISDNDSGHYSGEAVSSDSSFRFTDSSRCLHINIIITPSNRQVYASVSQNTLVNHVKQKLFDAYGHQITNSINYGLFLPESNGKKEKFLEEDRPISAYVTGGPGITLEFTLKKRLVPSPTSYFWTSDKSKNVAQSFMRAVSNGELKKVEKILAKGFDPNFICPKSQESPLSAAVCRPKPLEMIRTLIAGGAHRDFRSPDGMTPLHKAAAIGNFEAVKALLDFGQSPNTLDAQGLTPLCHNILGDVDTRICHRLLYEHAQIEIYDANGKQEIHQASLLGKTNHLNLLIMYGADVNARSLSRPSLDPPGPPALPTRTPAGRSNVVAQSQLRKIIGCGRETPLHYAAIAGQCATARRLLYWGADPTLTNDDGNTPEKEARSRGNKEVADVIKNFRGGVGCNEPGGSDSNCCGPFLPTPTYNPHRRPMVASLQLQPGNFVSLMEIGIDRKIPTRSTTMLFPVSPINAHSLCRTPNNQLSDALMTNSNSQCQLGPSPELPPTMEVGNARGDNLLRLRSRASSEGDLFTPTKPVSDLQTNVEGVAAEELEVVNGRRVIQSSRERRTHRLRRRARMTRGGADGAPATERAARQNGQLRSWKSTNALNDDDKGIDHCLIGGLASQSPESLSIEEEKTRQRGVKHCGISFAAHPQAHPMSLTRFKTEYDAPNGLATRPSSQLQISSQNFARQGRIATLPYGDGGEGGKVQKGNMAAPCPVDPFHQPLSSLTSASPRPVSPRQRESHHFARSPVRACSPSQSPTPLELNYNGGRGGSFVSTRTVELWKAFLPDAPAVPTLGLTLGTVRNASQVVFTPTPEKPSLQLIKYVKPASPAFNAGLREGDYVVKINHVDVIDACHDVVVGLLDSLKSEPIILEVTRPYLLQQQSKSTARNNGDLVEPKHRQLTTLSKGVVRSVSMTGKLSHGNGPAPYSPLLPMHAPLNRCLSPEENSVSSSDEAFYSQSVSQGSSRLIGNQKSSILTDRRNGSDSRNSNPPRIHPPSDYRLRNQFPNQNHANQSTNRLRGLPKLNTIESFSENIGVDTRNRAAAATISSLSLNPLGRQNLAGACPFSSSSCNCQQRPTSSNRAIHSVQQPPLRFLPHYSPPARRGGTEVRRRDCRQEGSRQESSRPLSMIGVPPVSINGYRGGDMPRSISSMSTTTPPPPSQSSPSQQQLQFDPYDLILPPPEEFCC